MESSECLLRDTDGGGVIVSPSASLPLNGELSAVSHAKSRCAALFSLKYDGAEWPKCFTGALNVRMESDSLVLIQLLQPRLKRPKRKSRGVASVWACTCKSMCVCVLPGSPAKYWTLILAGVLASSIPHPSQRESRDFSFIFLL